MTHYDSCTRLGLDLEQSWLGLGEAAMHAKVLNSHQGRGKSVQGPRCKGGVKNDVTSCSIGVANRSGWLLERCRNYRSGWRTQHSSIGRRDENATATLQRGLTISKAQGTPISAKFEIEDGKLQLKIYTTKGYDLKRR